jgi:signal transduction histidine kinase
MAASNRKTQGRAETAAFTVDTQVFRELGELLVGRDSTALLELVKNSYDADASFVAIHGESLSSPETGQIIVRDDGNGMTLAQFRDGFLRLAGRGKTLGERRSQRFGRRFTGEKGVGRLAAHKLANLLDLESVPWSEGGRPRGVRAHIDWVEIERRRTLEQAGEAISLVSFMSPKERANGTAITLSRLRHAWTETDLADFAANAAAFAPPEALINTRRLRDLVTPAGLLIGKPRQRDHRGSEDPGFRVELTGEFVQGSEFWDELIESVEWVLEIDAQPNGITFSMAPTKREREATSGQASHVEYSAEHPDAKAGPFFQARIFARDRSGTRLFQNWSRAVAGIRVYSEGFRVLPYGSPDNDWLRINRDYAARKRTLETLLSHTDFIADLLGDEEDEDRNAALTILPVDSYVGAVFLTREQSGDLEMLVNREGFVDNEAFANLQHLVRLGVDLLTRARAAGREEVRAKRRERETGAPPSSDQSSNEPRTPPAVAWRAEVSKRLSRTQSEVASIRASVAAGDVEAAEARLASLEREVGRLTTAVDALVAEQRLTPVLASLGIQMAEFVHEVNGLLAMATTIDSVLGRLRDDPDNFASAEARQRAAESHQTAHDLRARLERQASYLIDLTSPTAVRRRSRQRLAERFDRAMQLVAPVIERKQLKVTNRIPHDVRTPPMYPAEITAVLLNLLTNAIKAAGEGGRIAATARERSRDKTLVLRLDNTGQAVDLDDAERWFRPFETTTVDVDPLLGQGMGLGLPISRGIIEEYGGALAFVPPRDRYATAIEIRFPIA